MGVLRRSAKCDWHDTTHSVIKLTAARLRNLDIFGDRLRKMAPHSTSSSDPVVPTCRSPLELSIRM
jgi:hypothetical protein